MEKNTQTLYRRMAMDIIKSNNNKTVEKNIQGHCPEKQKTKKKKIKTFNTNLLFACHKDSPAPSERERVTERCGD